MSFSWSKYQQDIFNYALDPDKGSFCIEAVAGAGKTTVLVEIAKRLATTYPDERILFVSFNKAIAEKLKQETADYPNMICRTSHSFGYSVIRRSKFEFIVDDKKWPHYIQDYYNQYIAKHVPKVPKRLYISNCLKLFHLCRANMVPPKDADIKHLSDMCGVIPVHNEIGAVKLMIEKSYSLYNFMVRDKLHKKKFIIDYDDMINLAVSDTFRRFIPKYKFVLCDEAQDLTTAQQTLITEAVKKYGGKLIPIGDGKQSIYFFSTGRENPFEQFKKLCDNVCLPLSVCYRCGKNIVNEAKKINPQIEAFENAEDGVVVHQTHMNDIENGDMILCRNNNPLLRLAMKFLKAHRLVHFKGKDIGTHMKIILDYVSSNDNGMSVSAMSIMLDKYLDEVRDKLINSGVKNPYNHKTYQYALETIEGIRIIAAECETVMDVRRKIGIIFKERYGNCITLSSIHRAKGLEADNVYIICPELMGVRKLNISAAEMAQEKNLMYVAVTRPKKKLVYVDVPQKEINEIYIRPLVKGDSGWYFEDEDIIEDDEFDENNSESSDETKRQDVSETQENIKSSSKMVDLSNLEIL